MDRQTILLTAGIVCLIAAIIGGGLKAFNIEMPLLQSLKRQIALGILGAALIYFSVPKKPVPPINPIVPQDTVSEVQPKIAFIQIRGKAVNTNRKPMAEVNVSVDTVSAITGNEGQFFLKLDSLKYLNKSYRIYFRKANHPPIDTSLAVVLKKELGELKIIGPKIH